MGKNGTSQGKIGLRARNLSIITKAMALKRVATFWEQGSSILIDPIYLKVKTLNFILFFLLCLLFINYV